ncbi:MAG: hypothetical protein JO171_06440 [Paludibacterium sp.]|uniref:hypothetical protein n=1 Tax=Paludibacterium sp. TaxID=1917523 RepID=UPI0025D48D62|nr:hypothetical protein [Paludibacterium sp.]MBV8046770.1 hypothetical protein [Paludibacterium sp.]
MTADGLQGSDDWLMGSNTNYNRILESVSGDRSQENKIMDALEEGRVEKWLVHTDPYGRVTVGVMDANGKLIPHPELVSKVIGRK